MTGDAPPPADDARPGVAPSFLASGDQEYFRSIEELFVALRGAPMLLSPADWQVARTWRRQGIPLAVVRAALEDVFAKRRERGATSRVNSLRYCRPAIEKAWRTQLELGRRAEAQAVGESRVPEGPAAVRDLLERVAARLPPTLPGAEQWQDRVRELSGDAESVERDLATLDAELLAVLETALPEAERSALRETSRAAAVRLSRRLDPEGVERVVERLAATRLRQRWGIEPLSLFAPGTWMPTLPLTAVPEPGRYSHAAADQRSTAEVPGTASSRTDEGEDEDEDGT